MLRKRVHAEQDQLLKILSVGIDFESLSRKFDVHHPDPTHSIASTANSPNKIGRKSPKCHKELLVRPAGCWLVGKSQTGSSKQAVPIVSGQVELDQVGLVVGTHSRSGLRQVNKQDGREARLGQAGPLSSAGRLCLRIGTDIN